MLSLIPYDESSKFSSYGPVALKTESMENMPI